MFTPRLIAGLVAVALLGTAGPAAAPPADIVGTWKVLEGSQPNIEEVWIFQIEDGEWKVTGLFYKGREEIGSCRGEKIVLKGGGLSFRRVFDKKPAPNYGDADCTFRVIDGKGELLTYVTAKPNRKVLERADKKD